MTREYKSTLSVAVTQLGVKELSGKNDGIPAERYMRGDKLPWCAGFVLWCNAQSQDMKVAPTTADYYRMRSVAEFEKTMRAYGLVAEANVVDGMTTRSNNYCPRPGDLVFFKGRGGSDTGPGRHMGIVEYVDGVLLNTIEGNASNAVARRQRRIHDEDIACYAQVPRTDRDAYNRDVTLALEILSDRIKQSIDDIVDEALAVSRL
jgi:hypothetical protein